MTRAGYAVLLAAALGGCTVPITPAGVCSAGEVQGWLGQRYDAGLARAVKHRAHALRVRVLRPGEAATADFRASRLTITLDERDKVIALTCG